YLARVGLRRVEDHLLFLLPTGPIFLPLHLFAGRQYVDGVEAVEHHGVFIGMRLFVLVGKRLGVRAVMDAARMQRTIARLDVVLAEEIAVVVEDELVVIGIAVEEG